jgi:hypothetical protein
MTEISIGPSPKFNVGESAAGTGNAMELEIHFPANGNVQQKRVNFQVKDFVFHPTFLGLNLLTFL